MPETGYSNLGVTVPLGSDSPPDVPGAFTDFADSFGAGQGKGKLLVVQDTGAAAWRAMKGDGTIDAEGNFQLGAGVVGSSELADGGVTPQKLAAAAKPTAGVKYASSGLGLTEAKVEIPGTKLVLHPSVASLVVVTGVFDFSAEPGAEALGYLNIDGVRQSAEAVLFNAASNPAGLQATVAQAWTVALTAAEHTITLEASRGPSGNANVVTGSTGFTYCLYAS